MVRNLPCNAGDASSIPGWGTKIPHAAEKLSPSTTAKDSCMPPGKLLNGASKMLHAATKTQ